MSTGFFFQPVFKPSGQMRQCATDAYFMIFTPYAAAGARNMANDVRLTHERNGCSVGKRNFIGERQEPSAYPVPASLCKSQPFRFIDPFWQGHDHPVGLAGFFCGIYAQDNALGSGISSKLNRDQIPADLYLRSDGGIRVEISKEIYHIYGSL